MSLVKLTQNGHSLYVNPDQVAIVSPHPELINQTNVTLSSGLNILVTGAASELAVLIGYQKSSLELSE